MKKAFCVLCLSVLLIALIPLAHSAECEGLVRVLLTRLNLTDRLEISLDGSYTLNDMAFQRGSDLIVSAADGTLMVYYEGLVFDAGKQFTLVRHAIAEEAENGLRFQGGYELHPGDLILSIRDGQLRAVLHIPLEEYLLGVVPYEMSDSFPLEALKAQAIAARTYALKRIGSKQDYDVVDNTNDQVYMGAKKENARAAAAIAETAGLCVTYKGNLADCYYSASNGGQTELVHHVWDDGTGDLGYLTMHNDPYDLENPDSTVKAYTFPKDISSFDQFGALADEIEHRVSASMQEKGYEGDSASIRLCGILGLEAVIPRYSDSPSKVMTQLKLSVQTEGRKKTVSGNGEETLLSPFEPLSSPISVSLPLFPLVEEALSLSINTDSNEIITVRETQDAFVLEARRFGHGVGLSQRGAQTMAGEYGWNYIEILRFYYPGTALRPTQYTYRLPEALSASFLCTPGPAATPTPRPTAIPLLSTPAPSQRLVTVDQIDYTSYLNLRAAANTQSPVLRRLYYNQHLIVLEDRGEWLRVRMDDIEGYVMQSFVSPLE